MLEILWQDERLIALAKPAGLASVPGRGQIDSVLEQMGDGFRLVHRLDMDTSGVFLLARDRDAQRHLCNQFLRRTVEKEYLALVAGSPPQDRGVIDAPLVRSPNSVKVFAALKQGQPAITEWQVAQRFGQWTLLKCFPKTGRTHQIRVHLKLIGLPLAIDPLYGYDGGIYLSAFKQNYKPSRHEERPLIGRLTLHAHRITFKDLNDQPVTVLCPPPKDFRAALNMLGKWGRA